MILISLLSLLIATLSPFLGLIFLVAIGGGYIIKTEERYKTAIFLLLLIELGLLYLFKVLKIEDFGDIFGGVLLVSWVFLIAFLKHKDFTRAFYYGSLSHIGYGIVRGIWLEELLSERVELVFIGYQKLLQSEGVFAAGNEGQMLQLLEQLKKLMLDYQIAIWSISMILALYVGTHLLARRSCLTWNHQNMRLPQWLLYLLIISLILAITPATKLIGLNVVFSIAVLFVIQGLAIIDYWGRRYLKRSKFILFATTFLMFLNIIFALIVALLGLSDYWFDVRGLNQS